MMKHFAVQLLFVSFSPVLQSSADIVKTVSVGSIVSFECETNSSKPLRWKFLGNGRELATLWIYNGVKFSEDWLSRDRTNVSFYPATGNGVLSIANVQESDNGIYSCLLIGKGEPLNWFHLSVIDDKTKPVQWQSTRVTSIGIRPGDPLSGTTQMIVTSDNAMQNNILVVVVIVFSVGLFVVAVSVAVICVRMKRQQQPPAVPPTVNNMFVVKDELSAHNGSFLSGSNSELRGVNVELTADQLQRLTRSYSIQPEVASVSPAPAVNMAHADGVVVGVLSGSRALEENLEGPYETLDEAVNAQQYIRPGSVPPVYLRLVTEV